MIFAGLDIGSTTTQCVAVDPAGRVIAARGRPTGAQALRSARALLDETLGSGRRDAVVYATGYGRELFEEAEGRPTEIACLARGVHARQPEARTAVDVGGQDLKVVRIGPDGRHANFVMNDRCAAGTGRFLEVMARVLELPLEEIADHAMRSASPVRISSLCTVFAESEVVSLIARGRPPEDILAGVHASAAERIAGLAGRLGVEPPVAAAGGGALNRALLQALGRRLDAPLAVAPDPQRVVALGAALLALRDRSG